MYRKVGLSLIVLTMLVMVFAVVPQQAYAQATCEQAHVVRWGENLYRISRSYGMSITQLQNLNNLGTSTRIYAGQRLCVSGSISEPQPVGNKYTIRSGDTLARIARQHGVDMQVLARVNNIANVNRIYVGQVITIPDVTIQ